MPEYSHARVAEARGGEARPAGRLLKKILLIVVVLIAYGSLYPWRFQHTNLPANPLWILLNSWPFEANRFAYRDAVVNIALYIPFGVFCFAWAESRGSRNFASVWTLIAGVALSASIEMIQLFDATRVCSMVDVICNFTGTAAGIALATATPTVIHGAVQEIEAAGAFRLSGTVALLYLWLGYLLFPFFPAFSLYALHAKLGALLSSGGWMLRDFVENWGGWLAVAALLETLAGPRTRRLLPVALLLLPLKLLVAGRSMTGSELVGAVGGMACWAGLTKLRRPKTAAGAMAVAGLVVGGVIPLHFTSGVAQNFTWVPFLASLQVPWDAAFVTLLKKGFLYGSAIWLLRDGERGWMSSTLLVAAPLAAVEGLQVFLPGRTPESTDPLLALLLGLGLMLLERRGGEPARLNRPQGIQPGAFPGL